MPRSRTIGRGLRRSCSIRARCGSVGRLRFPRSLGINLIRQLCARLACTGALSSPCGGDGDAVRNLFALGASPASDPSPFKRVDASSGRRDMTGPCPCSSAARDSEDTYDALEFLGDAALGLAVTAHFFCLLEAGAPVQLHRLREATVMNGTLAFLACVHGVDSALVHQSPALGAAIARFKQVRPKTMQPPAEA